MVSRFLRKHHLRLGKLQSAFQSLLNEGSFVSCLNQKRDVEALITLKGKISIKINKTYKNVWVATPGYHEGYDSPLRELVIKKSCQLTQPGIDLPKSVYLLLKMYSLGASRNRNKLSYNMVKPDCLNITNCAL